MPTYEDWKFHSIYLRAVTNVTLLLYTTITHPPPQHHTPTWIHSTFHEGDFTTDQCSWNNSTIAVKKEILRELMRKCGRVQYFRRRNMNHSYETTKFWKCLLSSNCNYFSSNILSWLKRTNYNFSCYSVCVWDLACRPGASAWIEAVWEEDVEVNICS
jgi:hypothetical protein